MRPTLPILRVAAFATCLALLALGAAACGGESDTATPTTDAIETPITPSTQPPPTTTEERSTAAEPEPVVATVRIVVRGGKAVGGIQRVSVKKGEKVTLVVVSDRADEVHLHGYGLTADTDPGKNAHIVFVAKLPGRFEIELEDAGLQIGEIEVRP